MLDPEDSVSGMICNTKNAKISGELSRFQRQKNEKYCNKLISLHKKAPFIIGEKVKGGLALGVRV